MGRTSDAKQRLMNAVTELIWIGSYGSTTIDQICERAGVKKGSFYYFFDSKATLAEEALQTGWDEYRARLDPIFSPSRTPLQRIRDYCEFEYQEQLQLKQQYGVALGCPICTLGTEISTLESSLCRKVNEIMQQSRRYFETTIRDAHAEGFIHAPNPTAKAFLVYTYIEGLLTQARIQNDVEVLRQMEGGILDILGIPASAIAPQPKTA